MHFAIVSDTHDHVWNLRSMLAFLKQQPIDVLLHCGDFCSPFILNLIASEFAGPIISVAGNNEGDWRLLAAVATQANAHRSEANHVRLSGQYFSGMIGDKRIAITHYPEIARDIQYNPEYDLVCYGHNHQLEHKLLGETLVINPGTLLGYNPGLPKDERDIPATFAIYDTEALPAQAVWFYQVQEPWRSPNQPGQVIPYSVDLERSERV